MSAPSGGGRKRHVEEEHEDTERWLVTYADMLTVLMALFIVMFAMSVVDKKKFEEFSAGAAGNIGSSGEGLLTGGTSLRDTDSGMTMDVQAAATALAEKDARTGAAERARQDLTKAQSAIQAALADKGLSDSVRFRIDERGLVVTVVTDDVLFDLGTAELREGGTRVLDGIAPALLSIPNAITVEGHTDSLPISGGRFPSNWELSAERATSVLRYLLSAHGLPATRLSAAGYADQRAVASNATPAGRSTNRRVEVIVRAMAPATDPSELFPLLTPALVTPTDLPGDRSTTTTAAAAAEESD